MTKQEHQLMIAMFAKQSQFVKALVDILREKKLITAQNQPAFDFSVQPGSTVSSQVYQGTLDSYLQAARAIGLALDSSLETPSQPTR